MQAAHDDLEKLQKQLMEAQAEMENIKAIATVSENTKQEAIDDVKKQWQEEVVSLQAIMKGRTNKNGSIVRPVSYLLISPIHSLLVQTSIQRNCLLQLALVERKLH